MGSTTGPTPAIVGAVYVRNPVRFKVLYSGVRDLPAGGPCRQDRWGVTNGVTDPPPPTSTTASERGIRAGTRVPLAARGFPAIGWMAIGWICAVAEAAGAVTGPATTDSASMSVAPTEMNNPGRAGCVNARMVISCSAGEKYLAGRTDTFGGP
ncbi:MAG: hypothetical protein WCP28_20020 [Actinomycetes bacterium]